MHGNYEFVYEFVCNTKSDAGVGYRGNSKVHAATGMILCRCGHVLVCAELEGKGASAPWKVRLGKSGFEDTRQSAYSLDIKAFGLTRWVFLREIDKPISISRQNLDGESLMTAEGFSRHTYITFSIMEVFNEKFTCNLDSLRKSYAARGHGALV